MKLAHYVKIPPRQVFAAQILGTLFSTFVSSPRPYPPEPLLT